ncbi:MAG: DUF1624 domain-containing protein [Eubacterium sp.]|nr:DUF1624 domain-containing protein [Eubacterium sp.]
MIKGAKRILILDEIRGFAILCMIFHHMFYDIGFILEMGWGYRVFDFLCIFQPLFWALFILTSGICSRLSRNPVKRGCIVLASGFAVSLVTAVIMPAIGIKGAEIYFGILSCLGCSMIITGILMPFINKGNEKIGMLVTAFLFFATYKISEKSLLFGLVQLPDVLYQSNLFSPLGFYNSSFQSADYFPLIPWLFMFLFGAVFGKFAKEERFSAFAYNSHSRLLQFIGKNSLWFYLAHQLVLYAIMYAIKLFFI